MLQGDRLGLREALPEAVAPQMVSPGGRFLVMLHPAADVWEFEPMRRFIEDLRHVSPQVTGVPVTHFESLLDMRGAFYRMAFLALVTVTAIIFADCRRPALTVLTLLPLLTGILWMVAIMGALSIPFSLANFFAVPILLGLSVDSSIHIMHRYREGGAHRLDLGATRRATILTWCTTAIGFGSLAFAHHQGLASLGQAMIIGSLSSMASVVVLLPALLAWRERRRAAAPPRCG
jgi:predicted RND superfamily exporter protein